MDNDFAQDVKNWLGSEGDFTTAPIDSGDGPSEYWLAPEVKEIAESLIAKYHEMLGNSGVRIEYLFRSNVPKSKGKLIFGITKKISGEHATLAGSEEPFFCIIIAHPAWEVLPQKHREALVDHELCHCGIEVNEKGDTKLVLRHHDIEEFGEIVHRWGAWSPDVQEFLQVVLKTKKKSTPLLDGKSKAAGEK
jgi:hypothetical protein